MNSNLKIAVVEDNEWFNKYLCHIISLIPEYEVKGYTTGKAFLADFDKFGPDIVSIDYRLPDIMGDKLMKQVLEANDHVDVLIISEQDDVETAIDLMRSGASDYLVKNAEMKNVLFKSIQNIDEKRTLKSEIAELKKEVVKRNDFSKAIIGKSAALKEAINLAERAVNTNISVVINGETGTGKDVLAKAIHYASKKKDNNFVAVNMAAIPTELIESELFGFEKGAFTNAHTRRIGKFEEANGGTLFLDEIGEMPLPIQSKLLRVLQEREVSRLGSNEIIKVDCRIICATHRNLLDEVKNGNFREDLYYRLFGLNIMLPPLREREQDVLLLANHFLKQFVKENELPEKVFSEEAKSKILNYYWPGNIRELRSIVELATVLSDGDIIEATHVNIQSSTDVKQLFSKEKTLREYSIDIVQHYLEKYDNDITKVSKVLNLGRTTIYRMLKEKE